MLYYHTVIDMTDSKMSDLLENTMLYDFYGELLTDHQKKIYEAVVFNDYSLSEVAKEQGISRQGVHDLIKRCNKLLNGYEDKLHLVERFQNAKDKVRLINDLVTRFHIESGNNETIERIDRIAKEILDDF